jgi:hypothetical protein
MSEAYRSTLDLSFDVRAGLVMRQIHHWAALIFIAAMVLHLCRIFFTGAFRKPREINWIIGVTLLLLGIFNGFAGYSLPDDLLSGTGLRIAYSIALSVPLIGEWLAFLTFGGEFQSSAIIGLLFSAHILLVPAAIAVLIAAIALAGGGLFAIRLSGARLGIARRLAGAREWRVGDLVDATELPSRAVRVSGRIRCPDPIVTDRDERLVALHRDVQVRAPGEDWRSIERIRESRGIELWDHDGSMPLDPAEAAEPLVAIPHVWRGTTRALGDPSHLAAIERFGGGPGAEWPARSITRTVTVVDRLLVLARVERGVDGTTWLSPPPEGYVISTLELDDAMRLLGGPRRDLLLIGAGMILLGLVAALAGLAALLIGTL